MHPALAPAHPQIKDLFIVKSISCLLCLLFLIKGTHGQSGSVFNIEDYGAKAGPEINNSNAIQKTIDACAAAGGGTVLIPAGQTFISGPIWLKSNMELHLETGAILKASSDEKLYTESAFKANRGEGMIWIGGRQLSNISITGQGTIDGNGTSFMGAELEDSYSLKPVTTEDPRPHLLTLIGCHNIRITDLTIRDAAYWTVHLAGCTDVVISGISLLNELKVRNSDGIDIDHSKNVRISDCLIQSGDDCICLKNRREYSEYGSCENIVVNNCIMTSRSCAIKIGSENMDSIQHAIFTNCIITKSNRGIGIQNRDEGTVSDIVFSGIIMDGHFFSDVWWGKAEPIYVTAYPRASSNSKDGNWRFPKGKTEGLVGRVTDIHFNNIQCQSENGIYIGGSEPGKISNIHFANVHLKLNKITAIPGGVYDRRPASIKGLIKAPTSGFYFDTADSISITNCSVAWGPNKPDYFKGALKRINVPHLTISRLDGQDCFPVKAVNESQIQ